MGRNIGCVKDNEENTKDRSLLYTILISLLIVGVFFVSAVLANKTDEYTYFLTEIEEDVYAISYNVHSRTPSENYAVVTLCCDGVIRTFEGDVFISYIDAVPYVRVLDNNITHGDKIYVYIQKGTVEFQNGVTVGK